MDWNQFFTALAASLPALLAAVAAFWQAMRARQETQVVGKQVDGRMSELIQTTAMAARAAGIVAGAKQEKADHANSGGSLPPG